MAACHLKIERWPDNTPANEPKYVFHDRAQRAKSDGMKSPTPAISVERGVKFEEILALQQSVRARTKATTVGVYPVFCATSLRLRSSISVAKPGFSCASRIYFGRGYSLRTGGAGMALTAYLKPADERK